MNIRDVLPRLVEAHEKGRLVPFLGAGMSFPTCPLWPAQVEALEKIADVEKGDGDITARADRALQRLRRLGVDAYIDAIRKSLTSGPRPQVTSQTATLANIYWPIVLTTNYDDLYSAAVHSKNPNRAPTVVGRGDGDCYRVLNALREPSEPLLWALHGYIGGQCNSLLGGPKHLTKEIVAGFGEYRRVVHRSPHFRRAFAEVFRSCSLLFLGAGLTDTHLLGLFSEILEYGGTNPRPHYAVLKRGSGHNSEQLKRHFNIVAIEVSEHSEVIRFLNELREFIDGRRPRTCRWTVTMNAQRQITRTSRPDVAVVQGNIEWPKTSQDCIAISVGIGDDKEPLLGPAMSGLEAKHRQTGQLPRKRPRITAGHVARYGDAPVYLVAARTTEGFDNRDLRVVSQATCEVLARAQSDGFRRMRIQLLAAGKSKAFPPRFSIAEMLRGYRQWWKEHLDRVGRPPSLSMTVQLVDPGVLFELRAGRIRIEELMTCDDVRFWVEALSAEFERILVFKNLRTEIRELARELDIVGDGWFVDVFPRPSNKWEPTPLEGLQGSPISDIGVVAGCTVRFGRRS